MEFPPANWDIFPVEAGYRRHQVVECHPELATIIPAAAVQPKCDQFFTLLASIWCLLSGPILHSTGEYLVPVVGTSSSLSWCVSGACCRDQFFTLPARIWCLLSGPILHSTGEYLVPAVGTSSSHSWCVSGACCRVQFFTLLASIWCLLSGPVLHSTGVYLVPAVGTSSSLYWTSSPLYWRVSGACCRDQFFTLLACIWCLLSGPVLHSSGVYLVPTVGTSSSLYW